MVKVFDVMAVRSSVNGKVQQQERYGSHPKIPDHWRSNWKRNFFAGLYLYWAVVQFLGEIYKDIPVLNRSLDPGVSLKEAKDHCVWKTALNGCFVET
ncbi:hypothetical protein [Paraburkholderia sp. SIMBA_030]|uniref:hypothetical protein n=1 Tax=Paraburkholderia sp. SIMBA_030 TaxID=3085773 RepID=UPI003978BF0A